MTGSVSLGGSRQFQWSWYRNYAYKCAISGHPTFLVIEPKGWVGREQDPADMFIYLHGGGTGWYKTDNTWNQASETWAHEEDPDSLLSEIFGRAVKPWPLQSNSAAHRSIFWKRLMGGWRILVQSMCDHDMHLGQGTTDQFAPPTDLLRRKVDGLQAVMSAVDYMAPTFAGKSSLICGTSAGTGGAWAMTMTLASEGRAPTGTLLDSAINTPRDACFPPGEPWELVNKEYRRLRYGWWKDGNTTIYLERAIAGGFNATPILQIYGARDEMCGGTDEDNWPDFPDSGPCDAKGETNPCVFRYVGLDAAMRESPSRAQPNKHKLMQIAEGGHVILGTKDETIVPEVERWIRRVTE